MCICFPLPLVVEGAVELVAEQAEALAGLSAAKLRVFEQVAVVGRDLLVELLDVVK